MRIAAYYRVSTPRQAERDLSIPDQRAQAAKWCTAKDATLVREFVEPGNSATDDDRPAFQEMIDYVRGADHPVDAILVHSYSRFMRDAMLLEFYDRKLAKSKVRIISITQEVSDDPTGKMMRQLISVFDEYSSRENAKHTLRTMKENATQGYWNGARPPFGYKTEVAGKHGDKTKKKLAPDPAEAETVQKIFELAECGADGCGPMGVKNIAKHLNERGVTHRGNRFHVGAVHDILSRTAYIGTHYFNRREAKSKTEKPKSEWVGTSVPAIVDEEVFHRVQANLKGRNPKKIAPRTVSGPTLLTGVATCSDCGGGMTLRTGKGGAYRYYTCATQARIGKTACKGRSIPLHTLDDLVIGEFERRILNPDRMQDLLSGIITAMGDGKAGLEARIEAKKREAAQAEAKLRRLYDRFASSEGDKDPVLEDMISGCRLQLAEAQREQEVLTRQKSAATSITPEKMQRFSDLVRQNLRNGDPAFRKAWLQMFISDVEVADETITIRGEKMALAKGIDGIADLGVPKVRTFVREWRPGRDSNP